MREAAVAFSAGLLSFATPCVLPLVPAYLGAIGARSTDPRRALLAALPFVLGFSAVFIALGAGAGVAGGALTDHRVQLIKLSGILIVAMGLVMLRLIPVPGLERTFAPGLEGAHASGSSLLLGRRVRARLDAVHRPRAGLDPDARRHRCHRRARGGPARGVRCRPGRAVPGRGRGPRPGDVGRACRPRPLRTWCGRSRAPS